MRYLQNKLHILKHIYAKETNSHYSNFLFFLSIQVIAKDISTDSLLYKIEQSQGVEKLQLLKVYAKQHENKEIINKISANNLIEEARIQNNIKYLTSGYEILSRAYANERNIDSLIYCIDVLNELGDEMLTIFLCLHPRKTHILR